MNPYVLTALVMCAVVLIALVGTAYLAVFFNRRAKADLELALDPLAQVLSGSTDLENAEVAGRWRGYQAFGRMANASEGPGRVFQVDLLDAAGGVNWTYTSNQHARTGEPPTVEYAGPEDLRPLVEPIMAQHITTILEPQRERYRVEYLRDQGVLRLSRSIRSRREIPHAESFQRQLTLLERLAEVNRPQMEAMSVPAVAPNQEPA